MVARRDVPVSLRHRRRVRAHASGVAPRLGGPLAQLDPHARPGSGPLRERTGRERRTRILDCVPQRRVHRGVDITKPNGARFLFNVSFKVAGLDWLGYHSVQSNAQHPGWVQFVEESTPRELELFGFPPPGHSVWTTALVEATALRYPKLDLEPWRRALAQ